MNREQLRISYDENECIRNHIYRKYDYAYSSRVIKLEKRATITLSLFFLLILVSLVFIGLAIGMSNIFFVGAGISYILVVVFGILYENQRGKLYCMKKKEEKIRNDLEYYKNKEIIDCFIEENDLLEARETVNFYNNLTSTKLTDREKAIAIKDYLDRRR